MRTHKNKAYTCWNNLGLRNRHVDPDVTICGEWKDFDVFEKWYNENWRPDHDLDKDLKFPGNKHYSPETCLFIPKSLNRKISHANAEGVYYYTKSCSWRAQGIKSNGQRGVIKQSKNKGECLKAYSEHLYNRYLVLCEEYPSYEIYLLKHLENI